MIVIAKITAIVKKYTTTPANSRLFRVSVHALLRQPLSSRDPGTCMIGLQRWIDSGRPGKKPY
jgi:hypothetical protein